MKSGSILIVGCGDLGARVGQILTNSGWSAYGACRNTGRLPEYINAIEADYTRASDLAFIEQLAPDVVIATFKPTAFSAEGYQHGFPLATKNLLSGLGGHRPRMILLVSSTRVYAERDGNRVDESSELAREGYAALALIEAEALIRSAGLNHCIVRFAGIYGDPDGRLIRNVAGGAISSPEAPVRYGNRIHRDDCAGFLAHLCLLEEAARESLYLGVDDDPAPQYEVQQWLSKELGVAPVQGSATTSTGRGSGHKRCDNRLLKESGYRLRYRDYRQGYAAVIAARD
ncbi:MAG: NAD(P)H-binding protein [Halioglobus sp.]